MTVRVWILGIIHSCIRIVIKGSPKKYLFQDWLILKFRVYRRFVLRWVSMYITIRSLVNFYTVSILWKWEKTFWPYINKSTPGKNFAPRQQLRKISIQEHPIIFHYGVIPRVYLQVYSYQNSHAWSWFIGLISKSP